MHIIIPSYKEPVRLLECIDTIDRSIVKLVVIDNGGNNIPRSNTHDMLVMSVGENLGYWPSINMAIDCLANDEPFVYAAADALFDPNWLSRSRQYFPDNGLGLLAFHDTITNGFNAGFGLTTKNWLNIVYGHPYFPVGYRNHYCDSQFSNFSKDLDRYYYDESCIVVNRGVVSDASYEHNHEDFLLKNLTDSVWADNGGRNAASLRLSECL